jgi:hypothetical protein
MGMDLAAGAAEMGFSLRTIVEPEDPFNDILESFGEVNRAGAPAVSTFGIFIDVQLDVKGPVEIRYAAGQRNRIAGLRCFRLPLDYGCERNRRSRQNRPYPRHAPARIPHG